MELLHIIIVIEEDVKEEEEMGYVLLFFYQFSVLKLSFMLYTVVILIWTLKKLILCSMDHNEE